MEQICCLYSDKIKQHWQLLVRFHMPFQQIISVKRLATDHTHYVYFKINPQLALQKKTSPHFTQSNSFSCVLTHEVPLGIKWCFTFVAFVHIYFIDSPMILFHMRLQWPRFLVFSTTRQDNSVYYQMMQMLVKTNL